MAVLGDVQIDSLLHDRGQPRSPERDVPLLGTRVAMPDRLLRRAGIVDSFEREGDFDEFFS